MPKNIRATTCHLVSSQQIKPYGKRQLNYLSSGKRQNSSLKYPNASSLDTRWNLNGFSNSGNEMKRDRSKEGDVETYQRLVRDLSETCQTPVKEVKGLYNVSVISL